MKIMYKFSIFPTFTLQNDIQTSCSVTQAYKHIQRDDTNIHTKHAYVWQILRYPKMVKKGIYSVVARNKVVVDPFNVDWFPSNFRCTLIER